jgi:dTMP kinase
MMETLKRFIVLEGGDGAGTTTQLRAVKTVLDAAGIPTWMTSEPTDAEEGVLIRSILSGRVKRDPRTIAHLFAADRSEHIYGEGGILERLREGQVVLCDRYILSSLAYQGVACGLDLPWTLNKDFPLPSLLLFFDVPPEISLARIRGRSNHEIYEELEFQKQVAKAYAAAIERLADRSMKIVRIDASLPLDQVTALVLEATGVELGIDLHRYHAG